MNVFRCKTVKFGLLTCILCTLGLNSGAWAKVTVRDMDAVRSLNVLAPDKVQLLNDFVREHFDDMLAAKDAAALSAASSELTGQSKNIVNNEASNKAYSDHYAAAVKKFYPNVLDKADNVQDKSMRKQLKIQVATVLAFTDNPAMINDILPLINNPQAEVRYWAIKSFTMPDMRKYLSAAANVSRSNEVHNAIKSRIASETDATVVAQAVFAALPASNSGLELIDLAVSKRIDMYVNWTIANEVDDLAIINKLCDMLESNWVQENTDKGMAVKIATQAVMLYTVAYQRFKMSDYQETGKRLNLIGEDSYQGLLNVMIDGEARFLQLAGNGSRGPQFVASMTRTKTLDKVFKDIFGSNGMIDSEYERNIYKTAKKFKGQDLFKDDTLVYMVLIDKPTDKLIENAENLAKWKNKIKVGAE
ncbi:MAG: hypothetical protein JEZ07_12375 [Phycisphaerae bacterium]|nr:hypothetical protein [Phycisphaerae bacterium]